MDSNQTVSLSPTQATPQAQSSSGNNNTNSSVPIRAPLSFDADDYYESALKTHSRNSSTAFSAKSFDSEEVDDDGFLSGEDGFETASDKQEDNLELPVMEVEEDIVPIVPIAVVANKSVLGGSSITPPKARVSGEDDDDEEEEVVEEEEEEETETETEVARGPIVELDKEVEVPKVAVLETEEGEEGGDGVSGIGVGDTKLVENGVVSEKPILDLGSSVEVVVEKGPESVEALEVRKEEFLPENTNLGGFVESSANGVLDSEVKGSVLEESPALDSGVVEVSNEGLVVSKEDILPENLKLGEVVSHEIGDREKEEVETKDEVVQEKESEEEVGGTKDEVVDEKNSEDLANNEASPYDAVPSDSKLVEDDKEVKSTSEEEVGGTKDEIDDEKNIDALASNQASSDAAVLIDSKLVEEDKEVKSIIEGDLLVETKPISLESESGDVRDVEENPTSEVKPLEAEVDRSVSLDVVSDQSPAVTEEPDNLKAVEANDNTELSTPVKNLEPVANSVVETKELEHQESKIESVEVQKDDDENYSSGVAQSLSLDSDNKGKKPEVENEQQTDVGTKLNEPVFGLAVDGGENVVGDELAGVGQAQKEMNSVQEDKMQALSTESSDVGVASQGDGSDAVVSNSSHTRETAVPSSIGLEVNGEDEDEVDNLSDYEEAEGSVSDEDNEELNFGGSGTAEQIMKELMRESGVSFHSGAESSQENSQRIDGQILMDSDEEVDTDEEGEGKELFDSAALAALLKAATSAGSEGGNVTITSQDGSRLFSVERPAGLGSSIRSLKPAAQPSRPNIFTSPDLMVGGESEMVLSDEEKKKLENLQLARVKFLRLIHRLGHSPDDAIAAQVLYRMVLAAGRQTGQAFSLETAKKTAMQLETEKSDDLDFSLNILVLGKTGVGKSATINSIFGEEKSKIGAFEPGTTAVKEIIGTVGGVKIRVFDTPGLRSSAMEQAFNRNVLSSVKKLTKKFPLDILLYVDRLDTQTRDLNDLPLLRTITNTLGSSIWRSAVVTLTHAASAPPDGPSGSPLSYEVFVAQRSHIVQQSIGQAVGDLRMMNPSLMNPVSLVENHPSCRKNREGHRILPNGQSWRPQLLLLCYSLKVLSEVSSLAKPQDPFDHRKLFGFRVRAPPLPYLLSSLLQSRAHPKLPDDQGGENVDSDIDLEDLSDSDQEDEEDEYDQLPPFKPLRKAQIAKLSKDQRKAYFDEYDYRVKLLQKKQWKEELKRVKEMKKKGKDQTDNVDYMGEDGDQEGPAAVPVPLPDMVLPPSFDGDSPAFRYRFLEPTSQLLARPVLDTHGWDHDCGYDGVSLEENLAIAGQFPGGVAVQITKDKKEFNIHLDSSVAAKHGENGSTLVGFDIQTIGKQLGYIVRGETKFKNFKKNKTTGGISVTFLGENVATGLKVEDQISIGKRLTLVGSTGTIRSQGDSAYGANLEVRLKEKDFPIGQDQSTLGLSLMRWRGDLALGANLQSQISIGRSSKMSVRVGLNNKLSGQITVRTSSSDQLQLALVGILPIAISIYRSIWPSAGESYSAY